jgi:hypothetical protein
MEVRVHASKTNVLMELHVTHTYSGTLLSP